MSQIYNIFYNKYAYNNLKTESNKVVVESFYGSDFSGDVRYIAQMYLQNNYEVYVVYNNEKLKELISNLGFTPILFKSRKYYEVFNSSKLIISNLNLIKRITLKDNQKFLQTWHGYPLKKMVRELSNKNEAEIQYEEFSSDMSKWNYLIGSSEEYFKQLEKSFGSLEGINKIYTQPPRISYLLDDEINLNLIYERYGLNKEFKYILYCPTWRSYNNKLKPNLDFVNIAKQTGYKVIIKPHVHDLERFKNFESNEDVILISNCYNIYELLKITEIIISDISSVILDFACISEKIILNIEDKKKYKNYIGFKYNVSEILGIRIKPYKSEEIIETINNNDFSINNQFITNNVIGKHEKFKLKDIKL